MPLPASSSRAQPTVSRIRDVQYALASAECSSRYVPASCSRASRAHMPSEAVALPSIRTSRSCTSWNLPMGRPNCSRVLAYSSAISYAASMTPTDCQATPLRVRRRIVAVSRNECASCSRSDSGTRHSSNVRSAFCTARSAILFSIFVAVRPGVSLPRTNPLTWSSASSRAQTTMRSANVPLPIQRLAPLSSHVSPSRRAVVRRPAATSEPPCGSVSANAPILRISTMPGSHRSRCSSDPQATMLPIASPVCTPKNVAMDGSACAISSARNPLSRLLGLGPGLSGSAYAARPRSAYCRIRWPGNSARAQYSLACGTTSVRRKARTRPSVSRSASSSSSSNR